MIFLLCTCTCALLGLADDDLLTAGKAALGSSTGSSSRARDVDESKLLKAKATSLDGALAQKGNPTGPDFFNIAHMVLDERLISWAERRGANAVEIDVVFSHEISRKINWKGAWPGTTFHGWPCDCSPCQVFHLVPFHLCAVATVFGGGFSWSCQTEGVLHSVLTHIAQKHDSHFALVHFDDKIVTPFAGEETGKYGGYEGYKDDKDMEWTGYNLGLMIDYYLFRKGFSGVAIVGGAADVGASEANFQPSRAAFFIGAIDIMQKRGKLSRTWIAWETTQDGEGTTWNYGISPTEFEYANRKLVAHVGRSYTRVRCNGISTCAFMFAWADFIIDVKDSLNSGVAKYGVDKYISWTADEAIAMHAFLSTNIHGLMTNIPAILSQATKDAGRKMPYGGYRG